LGRVLCAPGMGSDLEVEVPRSLVTGTEGTRKAATARDPLKEAAKEPVGRRTETG